MCFGVSKNLLICLRKIPTIVCRAESDDADEEEACEHCGFGRTRDDAAGECMDKAARAMGLPYPGGVNLDKISVDGDSSVYKLPRPRVDGSEYDFSFSGLKTSVINMLHTHNSSCCATLNKLD